jgi:hypothetical protein
VKGKAKERTEIVRKMLREREEFRESLREGEWKYGRKRQ